jgi:hypothetical protein
LVLFAATAACGLVPILIHVLREPSKKQLSRARNA